VRAGRARGESGGPAEPDAAGDDPARRIRPGRPPATVWNPRRKVFVLCFPPPACYSTPSVPIRSTPLPTPNWMES